MSGKFKGGLYKGCPAREEDKVIGVGLCSACDGRVHVKMNKTGWPYYHCRDRDCGHDPVVRGKGAAVKMLKTITHWHARSRAFINAIHVELDGKRLVDGRASDPEPKLEPVAPPEPEPVALPEPEPVAPHEPKAKKKRTIRIGMFNVG